MNSRNYVVQPASVARSRKLSIYFVTAVAALGGLLFGYGTGVISGAQLFLVKTFALNEQAQAIAVSCVLVGAVIGALASGKVNEQLGRRRTMLSIALIFGIGSLLIAISGTFALFILFRMIVGVAIGAAASVVPVYISEMAPPRLRGTLVTVNQIAITIGIASSYWADLLFARLGMGWPPMFALAAIPSLFLLLGMWNSPETPRWLASKGRWEEAQQVLEQIQGLNAEQEMQQIRDSLSVDSRPARWSDLLARPVRHVLFLGLALAVLQQIVGINTVIYYAPSIFQSAGASSENAAILSAGLVGLVNVLASILATFLVDKLGRRILLILGSLGMIVSLFAIGLIFANAQTQSGGWLLGALMLYIVSFALSMGPIVWLLIAEIFPNRLRGLGASICSFSNWLANLGVSLTFLSLLTGVGPAGTFWLYAGMSTLGLFFCWFCVPETKGKTLEQIEDLFSKSKKV